MQKSANQDLQILHCSQNVICLPVVRLQINLSQQQALLLFCYRTMVDLLPAIHRFNSLDLTIIIKLVLRNMLFCLYDFLCPNQQFFSYVGTGLPGLNQYYAGINVSCSRPQHSVAE